MPNGIVATTQNAYVSLRRFLVEDSLVAVVSLPAGVFKPYSGVKTSILLLDKKLARRTDKILFLKIAADGFDLGDQRREIKADDLPDAERVMRAWSRGELGRAHGPTPFQHGATPHEPNPAPSRGLKARPIYAANKSGLQPSAKSSDQKTGALPQAGMASAVGAQVAWKLVAKRELLEQRACNLQIEAVLGSEVIGEDIRMVSFEELCVRKQYGLSVPLNTNGVGTSCFRMNELPGGRATDTGEMKRADISPAALNFTVR